MSITLKFSFFLFLILGAFLLWKAPDFFERVPKLPIGASAPSALILQRSPKTLVRQLVSKGQPLVKITFAESQEYALVPADGHFYQAEISSEETLVLTVVGEGEFDSLQLWGAKDADYLTSELIFDWSENRKGVAPLTADILDRTPYFRVRWNDHLQRTSKIANFSFRKILKKKGPRFLLTFQSTRLGQKEIEVGTEKIEIMPRKDSLMGLRFEIGDSKWIACEKRDPDHRQSDCLSWLKEGLVTSLSPQDLGLHQIRVETDQGQFLYQFELTSFENEY